MHGFGQIPSQTEVSVPQEVARPCERQGGVFQILHVAFLQLIVVAHQVCVESDVLRNVTQREVFENAEPFALALDGLFEWFEGLEVGRVRVVEIPLPVDVFLPSGGLACGVAIAVSIAEGEVGRVVGHGMPLGGDVKAQARNTEVAIDDHFFSNVAQRVAFVLIGQSFEGIVHRHVCVERIIARHASLL